MRVLFIHHTKWLSRSGAGRIFLSLFLFIFPVLSILSQPEWISVPAASNVTPYSFDLNFELSGQRNNVYIIVYSGDFTGLTSQEVKTLSALPDSPPDEHSEQLLNVRGPQTVSFTDLVPGASYSVLVVAESLAGVLQVQPYSIYPLKTPPCPPPYILTGFPIPTICVNKGTTVYFTIESADADPLLPGKQLNPDFDGIYAGTLWSLDWGDGTVVTFTSTADNEIPTDLSFISHMFAPNPTCVIEIELTITNPCGRMAQVSYPLDLHSRDHFDLNGVLLIEENLTGLTMIPVCEGNEHHITLRDNSNWNCQPPVPVPGRPNTDPRTIQWIYGESNTGEVTNTIGTTLGTGVTEPVIVGGSHNATILNGYTGSPVIGITSTGQLSEEIVIPATCRRDEYFDVYLLNWNKCNPYGTDEPVYTHLRILVVAAPAPPVAPDRTICLGDATTLTAAHGTPAGTILTWYSNPDKTGVLASGAVFTPDITAPGIYSYYVADQGAVEGNLCEGPVTRVNLNVLQVIDNNNISGPQTICSGEIPAGLTGTFPAGGAEAYTYQWQSSTESGEGPYLPAAGENTNQNYSSEALSRTTWYRRIVTSGFCSNISDPVRITVNPLPEISSTGILDPVCFSTSARLASLAYASSANSPVSYSINWTGMTDQGNTPFTFLSGGGSIDDIYIPAGTPAGTYNGMMTLLNNNGCLNSLPVAITVNSLPAITTSGNISEVCSSVDSQITTLVYTETVNNPASYSIDWNGMADQGNSPFEFEPGGGIINNIVIPGGAGAGVYSGTLTISNANGCIAQNPVSVQVNGSPVITVTVSDPSICSGSTAAITVENSMAGAVYQLRLDSDDSAIGPPLPGDGGPLVFNVSPVITTVYNILAVITSSGCQAELTDKSIVIVNPASPGAAGSISGPGDVCFGQTGVILTIEPVAGASNYVWSVPANVSVVSGQGTPSLTVDFLPAVTSPATFTVYPENGCGQGAPSSKIINIYSRLDGGIIADDQTLCYSTDAVPFTSILPASGGTGSFTYTWQYTTDMNATEGGTGWTDIPSTNSILYDHGVLDQSAKFVRRAVEVTCGTPVYSNTVSINIRPQVSGGTIAGDQIICYEGDVAAFVSTEDAAGGTGVFAYTWQYTTALGALPGDGNWTDIPLYDAPAYDHGTLPVTTMFVRQATDGICLPPVYSNIVTVIIRPPLDGGEIAGDQTICYGDIAETFTSVAEASGGDGVFSYIWQYTTNTGALPGDASWTDIPSGNSLSYSHDALTTTTMFIRKAVEGTCSAPVYSNTVTVTVLPRLDGGVISGDQTLCYNEDAESFFNIEPAAGGAGVFTYTWQYTDDLSAIPGDGNWTDIPAVNNPSYNHRTLTTTTKFVRRAVEGTCITPVFSNEVTVSVRPLTEGGRIGEDQTVCANDDPDPFTNVASPSGGGNVFTYTWQYTTVMSAIPGDGNWTDIPGSDSTGYDHGILSSESKFVRRATDIFCSTPVWSNTVKVSVDPLPVTSAITGDNELCSDEDNKVYQVINTPGSSYTWTLPDGLLTKSFDEGLYFIIADALPGASGTGIIMVTEKADATGCSGAPVTFEVVISPVAPGEDISGPGSICVGSADVSYSVAERPGSTYSWVVPAGASISNAADGHQILVRFSTALTGTISVVETTAGGCTVIHHPKTIVISPLPQVYDLTSTDANCTGNPDVTITLSGSETGVNYQLFKDSAPDGTPVPGTGSPLSWLNKEAGTYFVVATTISPACAQNMNGIVVPSINFVDGGEIGNDQSVCQNTAPAPLVSIVAGTGSGVITYQWQSGFDNSTFDNIPGAYSSSFNPGLIYSEMYFKRITYSKVGTSVCMDESNVISVKVNPLPVAVLSGEAAICAGESAVLRINLPSGTGPFDLEIENHGIVTGYVSGSDITVQPGVTTAYRLLRVKDTFGCEIVSPNSNLAGTAIISVTDPPVLVSSPENRIICEYGATTFNITASGNNLQYLWYVNKGSGWEALSDGGAYFGTGSPTLNIFGGTRELNGYIYHAVVTGCGLSLTSNDAMLTVNIPPAIEIQPVESTICADGSASFSVTANGTGLSYQWQVKTGSGFVNVTDDAVYNGSATQELNLSNVPVDFNNYVYRVIISGTCPSPAYSNFVTLKVTAPPLVTLNPIDISVCENSGTAYFTANGSGLIDSIRWQVNSGGIWSDIYDNEIYTGTSSRMLSFFEPDPALNGNGYRLVLKTACTDVYSDRAVLNVNPNPEITFSPGIIEACGGDEVIMSPVITGGSGTWLQHAWAGDVGPLDNYSVLSPVFSTSVPGSYNLDYRVRDDNGCIGTGSVKVIVDSPDADFGLNPSSGCSPFTVSLIMDTTGLAAWSWDFGDGSPVNTTDAAPVHIYNNTSPAAILYRTVTLSVESERGCTVDRSLPVTVYPAVNPDFTADKLVICDGEPITFTALPGASTYEWNYGDGTLIAGMNVTTHMFSNPGLIDITRTVSLKTSSYFGCIDTGSIRITVKPGPAPQFDILPAQIQEFRQGGTLFSFVNGTPGTFTWAWTFGDGGSSSEKDPSHTFNAMGDFNVTLEATNGVCTRGLTRAVSVTPKKPLADFDSIPSGCEPLTITVSNTSLHADVPGTSYFWEFGDGGTSVAKNPTYTYFDPGIFKIKLTVKGPGGESEHMQTVHVYPTPIAAFEIAPTLVYVNDEKVRAFNLSQGADYYLWEWGDGDTSKIKEPFHKYMESGVYDISLSAYKDNGNGNICYDKYTLSPGVTVEPTGDIRFATVFRPNLTGPVEGPLPTGGEEIDQFFFPPIREKVVGYKLQIFNRFGVLIFESRDINIPWNGYYKGQLCQQGVYVWYVEGKYSNGQVFKKVGDITLLH